MVGVLEEEREKAAAVDGVLPSWSGIIPVDTCSNGEMKSSPDVDAIDVGEGERLLVLVFWAPAVHAACV